MMRYLQHDTLTNKDLQNFDAWASTFGETTTSIELAPEGTGYRARTRFAKFYNLPELMGMFKEVADIQTADMLDLPVPKANFHTVVAKPTDEQKVLIERLAERATEVHNRQVPPERDNMLVITSDGRKIGLDQRLIDPLLPDNENSKVNICMRNIYDIWEKSRDKGLTQLVFCDLSTPGKEKFNVYDDIKKKLIENGIPEEEIAFIHDANTDNQKDMLFDQVRKGEVRVLFGSTFKMGAGTNCQDRLNALHDLDCPWRPSDLEQRRGRIVRQGNQNAEVDIFRYVTEGSFDSYLYQTIENKQKFISQIMTSKTPLRSCEDADESVLSYAEIKALCAGDERIREKMDLDIGVSKLAMLKNSYMNTHYTLEDQLRKELPTKIRASEERIAAHEKDLIQVEATKTEEFSSMQVAGMTYNEKVEAGAAIIEECKKNRIFMGQRDIGEYRGFQMSISFNVFKSEYELYLKGAATHSIVLSDSPSGNITRIENAINDGIQRTSQDIQRNLESLNKQVEDIKIELDKPFEREGELREKSARLNELNILLSLDKRENEIIGGDDEFVAEIEIDGKQIKESAPPTENFEEQDIEIEIIQREESRENETENTQIMSESQRTIHDEPKQVRDTGR